MPTPNMDPNQILALMQAHGMTVPPNALQLIQNWQAQRAAAGPSPGLYPGAGAAGRTLQNWRAMLPQTGQGEFGPFARRGFERPDVMQRPGGDAFRPMNPVLPPGASVNLLPMNFPNPMLPSNPVTSPGVPVTPFNPAAGKGGGVGRTMTGGNPNFGAMAY